MVDGSEQNEAFKFLMGIVAKLQGDALTVCKSDGPFHMTNITLNGQSYLLRMPAGDYKVEFLFFDEIDSNIFNLTYYSSIFA